MPLYAHETSNKPIKRDYYLFNYYCSFRFPVKVPFVRGTVISRLFPLYIPATDIFQ